MTVALEAELLGGMTAIFRDVILEGGRIIGTILSKLGIVRGGACLFSPRSPSCTTIGHSVGCAHLTHRQLPPHTLCQWLRASVRARHRTRAVAPAHIFSCAALVARVLRSSWKCAMQGLSRERLRLVCVPRCRVGTSIARCIHTRCCASSSMRFHEAHRSTPTSCLAVLAHLERLHLVS
jgi:hypothetical protein